MLSQPGTVRAERMPPRRRLPTRCAVGLTFALGGCLLPVEPTPTSALVRVETAEPEVSFERTAQGGVRITVGVTVTNTATQAIRYEFCAVFLEQLIRGRWWPVVQSNCPEFGSFATVVEPGRSVSFDLVTQPHPRAEYLTGKHRVRIRFTYAAAGLKPLPDNAGYSRPFDVVDR